MRISDQQYPGRNLHRRDLAHDDTFFAAAKQTRLHPAHASARLTTDRVRARRELPWVQAAGQKASEVVRFDIQRINGATRPDASSAWASQLARICSVPPKPPGLRLPGQTRHLPLRAQIHSSAPLPQIQMYPATRIARNTSISTNP